MLVSFLSAIERGLHRECLLLGSNQRGEIRSGSFSEERKVTSHTFVFPSGVSGEDVIPRSWHLNWRAEVRKLRRAKNTLRRSGVQVPHNWIGAWNPERHEKAALTLWALNSASQLLYAAR